MITIRQAQMDAFKDERFRSFSRRVLVHLEKKGIINSPDNEKLNFVDEKLHLLRDKTGLDSELHLVDMLIIYLTQDVNFLDRKDIKLIIENKTLSKQNKYWQIKELVNE